jgi:glycosyltransferase involved in cell wall biosynthesis
MNVLVLTNMYPSERHTWSGSFVKEQVEDLRALGIDIELMVIEGAKSRLNYLRGSFEVRRRVVQRQFDVIHAHYGLTGAVALAQRRAPVITTFHGGDTHVRWQSAVSWVVARRSVPIFVSEVGRAVLSRPAAAVIPTGVDTRRFQPRPMREARDSLGWSHTSRYVLFPGARHDPVKCFSLFERVIDVVRQKESDVRTAYLEDLSRDQVACVMNAVDVTLLTSANEGSPVAVRESLATGTPVVSVPVGDMSSLLAGLPGCLVGTRNPEKLADAVLEAIRAGKHSQLRARAEETSRDITAARIRAVYEDVLRRGQADAGGRPVPRAERFTD